ncbi:MAG: hypothetical protein KDM81_09335, partial [Verrucomicrobiae bacterium]|nr:hypothetical protein [Verrucomicrobiae bacterium]
MVAGFLEELRRTGELEDMKRYGLITNQESEIEPGELVAAKWRLDLDHPPLGIEPVDWETIPPPDLKGTDDPGAVEAFIRTNGWNMHTGAVIFGYGGLKTEKIKGLPWKDIAHREFDAITANGIFYAILDGFHHSCLGVAFNPITTRFTFVGKGDGFTPIGDHWYAWRQLEDPIALPQRYEGQPNA